MTHQTFQKPVAPLHKRPLTLAVPLFSVLHRLSPSIFHHHCPVVTIWRVHQQCVSEALIEHLLLDTQNLDYLGVWMLKRSDSLLDCVQRMLSGLLLFFFSLFLDSQYSVHKLFYLDVCVQFPAETCHKAPHFFFCCFLILIFVCVRIS